MRLADARWIELAHNDDERGTLTALEQPAIPFPIRRIFYMHRVPGGRERGSHAHRHTQQCIIPVAGALTVDASDAESTVTYVLDDPNRGLYLPTMIWVRLYAFRNATVALVLCDTVYNPAHVVRDRDQYDRLVRKMSSAT